MARKKTEQTEKEKALRLQLTDWIYAQYDVSFLPTYVFVNLDKVYKGTYKNLNKPIPVEELFDMWQRKIDYLNQLAAYNESIGKTMTSAERVLYDLAVLLAKYDGYCNWKARQEAQYQKMLIERLLSQEIDSSKITQLSQKNNNDIDDISKLIDEV